MVKYSDYRYFVNQGSLLFFILLLLTKALYFKQFMLFWSFHSSKEILKKKMISIPINILGSTFLNIDNKCFLNTKSAWLLNDFLKALTSQINVCQ